VEIDALYQLGNEDFQSFKFIPFAEPMEIEVAEFQVVRLFVVGVKE
jgi:hypothetical protein